MLNPFNVINLKGKWLKFEVKNHEPCKFIFLSSEPRCRIVKKLVVSFNPPSLLIMSTSAFLASIPAYKIFTRDFLQ